MVTSVPNQIFGLKEIRYHMKVLNLIHNLPIWNTTINEPTHLVADSSGSINLMFTSQPNLVMESKMHSSLHPNDHHQITYTKFIVKIYYHPPCEWKIYHYEKPNVDHIRRAVNKFSWERSFENNSVNGKVNIFNTTIKYILSNYIP